MIRFTCTCGKVLQVADELAGRRVRCPACQAVLSVPGGAAAESAGSGEGIRAEPAVRRPRLPEDGEEAPDGGETVTSRKAVWSLVLGIASFCCSLAAGIPAVVFGALALSDINKSRGRTVGTGLAVGGIVTGALGTLFGCLVQIGLMLPAVQKVREAAATTQSINNLKQMALAMHNFHDTYRSFPPAAGCQPEDGPAMDAGLSWRVALLPFLEEGALYREFKLNEPWDSPNNKRLLERMPKVYMLPGAEDPPGMTHYRVFVGTTAAFAPPEEMGPARGRSIPQFTNGLSNSILIIEAADAVPWTKPDELPYTPGRQLPRLRTTSRGTTAAMADGSVQMLPEADILPRVAIKGDENPARP
jgi:hypothetical protein